MDLGAEGEWPVKSCKRRHKRAADGGGRDEQEAHWHSGDPARGRLPDSMRRRADWLPTSLRRRSPRRAIRAQIAVYFSPHGGCTDAIVKELDAAKESVLVQAYSFTSAPIAKALMEAHKRGVKVQVILDKSQRTEKYSSATFF